MRILRDACRAAGAMTAASYRSRASATVMAVECARCRASRAAFASRAGSWPAEIDARCWSATALASINDAASIPRRPFLPVTGLRYSSDQVRVPVDQMRKVSPRTFASLSTEHPVEGACAASIIFWVNGFEVSLGIGKGPFWRLSERKLLYFQVVKRFYPPPIRRKRIFGGLLAALALVGVLLAAVRNLPVDRRWIAASMT